MRPFRAAPSWKSRIAWFLAREQDAGKSPRTLANMRKALLRMAAFLGRRRPRNVTAGHVERYAACVVACVSRGTARQYLWAVRRFFAALAEEREIFVNPAAALPLPRAAHQAVGRVLTHDETRRLLATPDVSSLVGLRDRALLELLYGTGLRATEVRQLRVEDVDGDVLRVRSGKGGKDRVVPIGKSLRGWLDRYLEIRPRLARYRAGVAALILSRWGRPMSELVLQQNVRKLARQAGVRFTCHALRRTFATHLLWAGASPAGVAELLGHANLETLARYAAVGVRELKQAHGATHPREADRE